MTSLPIQGVADRPNQTGTVADSTEISKPSTRLLSLDVFRGLVILSMLIVNNIGDSGTTGYFWKHADWPEPWLGGAFREWWQALTSGRIPWYAAFSRFPVFLHCTLADYVMPSFMLIIGLAIPYSVASSLRKKISPATMWIRVVRRAFLLVVLGWILCYFRDQFAPWIHGEKPFSATLGMDVLQLLGVGYLVARIAYQLPPRLRLGLSLLLFAWHWAFLRFWPQGDVPAGTFTEHYNAVAHAYASWNIWSIDLLKGIHDAWRGRLILSAVGLLSVPPAAATMLLGTIAGEWLQREDVTESFKVKRLALAGVSCAAVGLAWAFDLPFNKPRWTPCYLLWCTGIDFIVLASLYWLIDIQRSRRWVYPFVVFGSNAIAAYFLPILFKVLFGNTPRVTYGGEPESVTNASILFLKNHLGAWAGGWTFTAMFVIFWWLVLDQMYRRKLFWKL